MSTKSQTRQPNISSAFLRTETDNHFVRRRKELRPAFDSPRAQQLSQQNKNAFNQGRYSQASPYENGANSVKHDKPQAMTPSQSTKKIGMRSALKFAEQHQRATMELLMNCSTQASEHGPGAQDMQRFTQTERNLPKFDQNSRSGSKLGRPRTAAVAASATNLTKQSQDKFKELRKQQNEQDAVDFCAPLPTTFKIDQQTGKRMTTRDLLSGYFNTSKNAVQAQKQQLNQKQDLPWFHEHQPLTRPVWELSKPMRDTTGVSRGETEFRYNFYKVEDAVSSVGAPSVVSKSSAKRLRTAELKSRTALANKVNNQKPGTRIRKLKWTQGTRDDYDMRVAKGAGDKPVFERHDYWDIPQGPFAKTREGFAYKDTETRNFPPKNIYQNTPLSTSQGTWKYAKYDSIRPAKADGSMNLTADLDKRHFKVQDEVMAYEEMRLWHAKKWDGTEYMKVDLPKK